MHDGTRGSFGMYQLADEARNWRLTELARVPNGEGLALLEDRSQRSVQQMVEPV